MGNKISNVKNSKKAVMLRVGRQFLRVNHAGEPCLISNVTQTVPDNRYTFWLADEKADEDHVDGEVLLTIRIQATRCGRAYYLCARENFRTHPYSYEVSFEKSRQATADCSTWILRRIPGEKFVLESYKFRKYCLSNQDGQLCLQRVSRARRDKHVTFYPIRNPEGRDR